MNKNKLFIILLLISPFFWWQFLNQHNPIFSEYRQIPFFVSHKISSIFLNTQPINEFRWNDVTENSRPLIGKLFYNKSHLLLSETITYLNILNPRFYFQSGSGQTDSPPQVEPIACFLFPVSILGIFKLIKKYSFKIILLALFSCFFVYITGHLTVYFLFPAILFYLYTGAYEISTWSNKFRNIYLLIFLIYSIFLFFRVLLITNL